MLSTLTWFDYWNRESNVQLRQNTNICGLYSWWYSSSGKWCAVAAVQAFNLIKNLIQQRRKCLVMSNIWWINIIIGLIRMLIWPVWQNVMMEKCIVTSIVRTAIVPHIVRQSILFLDRQAPSLSIPILEPDSYQHTDYQARHLAGYWQEILRPPRTWSIKFRWNSSLLRGARRYLTDWDYLCLQNYMLALLPVWPITCALIVGLQSRGISPGISIRAWSTWQENLSNAWRWMASLLPRFWSLKRVTGRSSMCITNSRIRTPPCIGGLLYLAWWMVCLVLMAFRDSKGVILPIVSRCAKTEPTGITPIVKDRNGMVYMVRWWFIKGKQPVAHMKSTTWLCGDAVGFSWVW